MVHCNPQMTDYEPLPGIGTTTGVYVKSRDMVNEGVSTGNGCSSNGTVAACSFKQSQNAIVVYNGDGDTLWTSGNLLDPRTFTTVPAIQTDGSMLAADDQHVIKFNADGSIAWSTPSPGGGPVGLIPTPNGAIFSGTQDAQFPVCFQGNCTLELSLLNGGSGYSSASVLLEGGYCPGASATASVSNGAVVSVSVTAQGPTCYIAPDVVVLGDGADAAVTAALASAGTLNLYSAANGALITSMYLYQTGNSGPHYVTGNTACLNNATYPNRVYLITNLNTDYSQGAFWALDIDPNNPTSPITPAWNLVVHGPSAATPLCVGDHIYFDSQGITPGDNVGTTILGVQDNGSSGQFLFQVQLGPTVNKPTANFAMDPRPEGGFWHQILNDQNIYHRDFLTGAMIEKINISNLLVAAGAPQSSYWQGGTFTMYGTSSQPYLMIPAAPNPEKANDQGYLGMLDLNAQQFAWVLPLAGNSTVAYDSPGGDTVMVMDHNQNPVLVTAGKQSGAFFIVPGGPNAILSPAQLSFGEQPAGTVSSAQNVSVLNNASSVLTLGQISITGPFSYTSSCGVSLAPGVACAIGVQFKPTSGEDATGTLSVASNNQGGLLTAALAGTGSLDPSLSVSSSQLTFPPQAAGTVSAPQTVTLQNNGAIAVAVSQIGASGAALETNNCPTVLATGVSCTIYIALAAPSTGSCSGNVTITSSAVVGPPAISVNSTCQPAPAVESALSATGLVFEPQTAGSTSVRQKVTLSNIGGQALSIVSISATADAVQSNNCPATLSVGTSCSIQVGFSPSAIGPRTGQVTVRDAAPDSPHVISISGVGLPNPVPFVVQPLIPASAVPGTNGLTLRVNGSGFVTGSTVYWNGSPRVTQMLSASQLSASLTQADLASPTAGTVSVVNPGPGGGQSNSAWLPVAYASPKPTLVTQTFTAGPAPSWLVAADFNLDGNLDLAVTNAGASTVSILPGNGDGTFGTPASYATGNLPWAAVNADFNHDGIPDLAVINQADNTVSILLGLGNGAFASQKVFATGNQPSAIITADLNGDGNLDLAIANQADNTVSVLTGLGDGTFAPQIAYAAGQSPDALAAADFNGDGKLDLAVGNRVTPNGTVTILTNQGDGSYVTGANYNTQDAVSLVAADFNGDGVPDFAAISYVAQTISVFTGNGHGGFSLGSVSSQLTPNLNGLAAADMNADGTLELVMGGNAAVGFTVLENNYAGTFTSIFESGSVPMTTSLAVGDFNNDGSIDAAVASYGLNTVSILMQAPAITVSSASLNFGNVAVGGSATQSFTVANTGSAVLRIGQIQATSPFSQNNNCAPIIASGNSCKVNVVFPPSAQGSQAGTLTISSNVPGTAQTVSLSGVGVAFGVSVSLTQNPAVGAATITGNTIVVSSAAPPSGWTVSLSSSNPAVAPIPAAVTVSAGQTVSSPFSINTANVSTSTPVTITATVNGTTGSVILSVTPIAVSFNLSASRVTGGSVIKNNTLVLAQVAPAGGLTFNLTTVNPSLVSLPASVSVAAGATVSSAFNITTSQVSSLTNPTIFASLNGLSGALAYANFTLSPVQLNSIVLSPSTLIGGQSSNANTVTLSSPAPASGTVVTLTSSNSQVASVPATVTVPANGTSAPFIVTTANVGKTFSVTISANAANQVTATLTVNPNGVASVNLASATTVGGSATINGNTVTLLAPAVTNGATVYLTSSNPSVASVPASVKVAGRSLTSGSFQITTTAVTVPTAVTISATYDNVTCQTALTVNPLEPASVTLSQNGVIGGKTVNGNQVTLNAVAPSPGVTVLLTSSNPSVASVPPSVVIAAGSSTSPKFAITTAAVQTAKNVTITATYQGYTATAVLAVRP